jgi:tetratricopeptide (TPR) repeat protein
MSTSRTAQGAVSESPLKLISWKSIANYFDCDERTAKRWERERGLPVHRMPGERRSGVFAYSSELDLWLQTGLKERNLPFEAMTEEMEAEDGSAESVAVESRVGIGGQPNRMSEEALTFKHLASRRRVIWSATSVAILLVGATLSLIHRSQHPTLGSSGVRASSSALRHFPVPGAEELYLRGRYFWNLRTADSLSKAIDAYTQAIVKDPSYAEAYAGLAESYDLLPQFAHADLVDSLTRARNVADRAIELNPNLAAAHRAKGFALFFGDWDILGSDAEFQRTLTLDPNSAETHQWYASTLLNRLEGAECMGQIDDALRLSPTSASIATDAALMHAEFGDDLNASIKRLRELEQTQPTLLTPSFFLRDIYFAQGDYPAHLAELRRIASITHHPDDIAMANSEGRGWERTGKTGLLEARIEILKAAFKQGIETGYLLGQAYLLVGRSQEALPFFNASLDKHFILLMTMRDCEWAKKLAKDPGYTALFDRIRERMHGGHTAHPPLAPISLQLPL